MSTWKCYSIPENQASCAPFVFILFPHSQNATRGVRGKGQQLPVLCRVLVPPRPSRSLLWSATWSQNQGLLSPPGGHGRYIRCESICVFLQLIIMTAILKSVKIQKNCKPALKLLWAGKTNFMKEWNLNFGYFRDLLVLCHILCMPR